MKGKMDFKKLAKCYESLEGTTKKLEKRDIVAKFVKETPAELLETVVTLMEGRIFPAWMETELGVAENIMFKVLSKVTGLAEGQVKNEAKKAGDIGTAAESILKKKKQRTLSAKTLTVENVYKNFTKIPTLTGAGSIDQKVSLISELLSNASPEEGKYVVRLILEVMRIGVGEGIIREALAVAYDIEPELIDKAYSVRNDYGEVAKLIRSGGKKALERVELEIGRPLKPMLAQKVDTVQEGLDEMKGKAAFQYKYDGMRCITGFTPIYVKDKGILSVRDVKVGDYVLTHKGNFQKVVAKNVRKIDKDERIFKFQTYLGHEFKITEGHEILINNNGIEKWVSVEEIGSSAEVVFPLPRLNVRERFNNQLTLSTLDGYRKTFRITKNFFRFLGFWIGDGYTNIQKSMHRIGIIFNKEKESKLSNFYKSFIKAEFGIENIHNNVHNGAIYLHWTDRPFLLWLSQNFRKDKRGWKGKTIPLWFWNLKKEEFLEFLKGWLDADGYVSKDGSTSITTKERYLATFAQLLCLKFKIPLGIKKIRIAGGTYYKLIFAQSKRNIRFLGNKFLVRIFKKEELRRQGAKRADPRIKVYNLQVEGDESYCTTMAALHNCQIHKQGNNVNIFTRRLDNITKQFPELVEAAKKHIKADTAIIEGEAVGIDPKSKKPQPFQKLSQRIKRKYGIEEMQKQIPVEMNIFDLLYLDEKNMLEVPYEKRWKKLEEIIKKSPDFHLAENLVTEDAKKAEQFYKKALNAGQEGLMIKNLEAKYMPGSRVKYMYKLKQERETLDLAIIGAIWGEGRRSKWLGSFVLGARDPDSDDFLEVGKVATGLTDEDLENLTSLLKPLVTKEHIKNVDVRPKIVVEVGFEEIQRSPTYKSGYALRFPRVKRIRDDKGPEDADDLERISRLYEGQKKVRK